MAKEKNNKAKIQNFIRRDDVSVTANIEENYIFTTEDKIQILYEKYNQARKSAGDFWTCFGIFLTLAITLFTCEFKQFLFIDAPTVRAMFILSTLVAFILCIVFAVGWFNNRKKLKFEYFISQIKGENANE